MDHVRELTRQRRHTEALAAARALAESAPENREALYLLAANQRCLQQIAAALATLEMLESEHPGFGRLYQERGYCFIALRDWVPAIDALQRAVALNPALAASWSALENLYRMNGDLRNAAAAGEHIATIKGLPAEIVQAGSLFCEGEHGAAESLLRGYLRRDNSHVEALRLLARIEQQRDALAQAERLFRQVLQIAPDYRAAREELARLLIGRQKYPEACVELVALLQLDPGNTEYRALQATAAAGLGNHEVAIAAYRDLLGKSDCALHLHLLLGHSLKALGQQDAAIESYRDALRARPDFGDAFWSFANLKTYRFDEHQIESMQDLLASSTTAAIDRLHLHFALGSALQMRGDYAGSWDQYERGNALKRAACRYRAQDTETSTREQIQVCSAAFFAQRAGSGAPDPDPIFIVGLPRAGSTLVEQILASHSLIEGTQELHVLPRLVQELQAGSDPANLANAAYPAVLLDLRLDDLRRLGERYLLDSRPFRTIQPARRFFIDKLPNNFHHIGLIHLMLPNAKIIDVRRSPMACCCSNLQQLYAAGNEFSYDPVDIGLYYRAYLKLIRHWDEVLPGRVLRVYHEDLVEDLEQNVRRMLEYCGLECETSCLEFHKTPRTIATASSEQVRQPLNREGLKRWMNYRPWLGGLKETLGDALVRWRD